MRSQRWVLYAALVTVCGCAGDGEGLDENGRPISEEDSGGELTATFESIQDKVFTPICTTCHTGASAPLGLRLDEGASYALLVNAPSAEVEGVLRVDPGNPDDSYLIRKLEGTAEVGGRMPLNAPALPASTIAIIRQWIVEGAQAPASDAAPAQLTAAWPVPDSKIEVRPESAVPIVVAADAQLDTTLIEGGTVQLLESGGDGEFDNGNEVSIVSQVQVRSLSPTVLAIAPEGHRWRADRYELRISGDAPLAVADLRSIAIDGDGDGKPGGDFVLRFEVKEAK